MFRCTSLGLGSVLVGLGAIWFFTPVLDGIARTFAGPLVISPLSKTYLSDTASVIFACLSVTGLGLIAIAELKGQR